MATPARFKNTTRPYQVVFHHTKAAQLPDRIERLVMDAQASFAQTTALADGTRSEQVRTWALVLARAVAPLERAA